MAKIQVLEGVMKGELFDLEKEVIFVGRSPGNDINIRDEGVSSNAYFRPGHNPGGFRVWWRRLTGSDAGLDTAHLMRMAGRFSRRVRAYAKAHWIPVIDCGVAERKHEIAEKHLETTTVRRGVCLILVGRAQAPVWEVRGKHHLERKRPMPYVNHYSFHILDRAWGHLTIKISGHPPFPAQVILNGH